MVLLGVDRKMSIDSEKKNLLDINIANNISRSPDSQGYQPLQDSIDRKSSFWHCALWYVNEKTNTKWDMNILQIKKKELSK